MKKKAKILNAIKVYQSNPLFCRGGQNKNANFGEKKCDKCFSPFFTGHISRYCNATKMAKVNRLSEVIFTPL